MIRKVIGLVFLAFLGFTLYVTRPIYLPCFAEFLIQTDPLEKADAIIVLAGDDIRGSRVTRAVELWREGWADELIVSGGWLARGVRTEDVMRKQAEEMGVPPEKILIVLGEQASGHETLADSTLEESRNLLAACQRRKFHRVLVVTSNYHTRRARRIFRHLFGDAGISVAVVASPDISFAVDHWWTRRDDARMWLLETEKLAFNYVELR